MRALIIAAVAALALNFGSDSLRAQTAASPSTGTSNTSETYRQLNLFGEVFERVRADFVDKIGDEELIESAINGMLTALDPHSGYMNAKSFRDMQVQTRGEFGGLGIEVTMENGLVKVVSPIDETPAARAGVQPGDFITHLDGEPIMGLTLNDAVEKMRGPVNTAIKLTIKREGKDPFDVSIKRDVVRIQSVRSRIDGTIGYIRITTFNEQTDVGLKKAIEQIKGELGDKLQGYVLDLRNNPGGLLDQAIAVSDAFLDKGEIVSTRGRRQEEGQRYNAKGKDLTNGLPMVVLINSGSASASEIVAGALQDHRRAILLGTRSFGKGSVQTIIPLPGHGAMRLTTARYYTPSGRSIQAKGIEPDIVVEAQRVETVAEGQRRREADLKGALANPQAQRPQQGSQAPNAAPAAPPAQTPANQPPTQEDKLQISQEDYQLARALDLLRGIALFQSRVVN
ncbi:MAG: S41 family peptidase [Proteobacteria bacterium]|nr:S41 family peptidase [Pseudomonadota bacterium]MBI3499518.1 S41 family peptidase [Pseudomonadota bacterium]